MVGFGRQLPRPLLRRVAAATFKSVAARQPRSELLIARAHKADTNEASANRDVSNMKGFVLVTAVVPHWPSKVTVTLPFVD